MTISVTILKPKVYDTYGILMTVGQTYSVDDSFGAGLVSSGLASDTNSALTAVTNVTNTPIALSSSAPVNADGRPDGTIWIQTA